MQTTLNYLKMNCLELKQIRKKIDLLQPEMAELLKISHRTYQNLEYGNKEIDVKTAENIRKIAIERGLSLFPEIPIPSKVEKNGKTFGLGDAVKMIIENLEEAKKIPLFAMILKVEFQAGEKAALQEYYEKELKRKS